MFLLFFHSNSKKESYNSIVFFYMIARATISFISRTPDTFFRANGKKMGFALIFAGDCTQVGDQMNRSDIMHLIDTARYDVRKGGGGGRV